MSAPTPQIDDGSLRSPLGRAALTIVSFLAILWIIDLVNRADNRGLVLSYGIYPRDVHHLSGILTAPFLHVSAGHLASNGLPLFGLGLVVALAGLRRFLGVTAVIIATSGAAVWLFGPPRSVTVGASGIIFGYFGYLVLRGVLDRRPVDLVVAVGVALSHGILLGGVLPGSDTAISWQGHLGGFIGGMVAAWLFRRRRPKKAAAPEAPGALPDPAAPTIPTIPTMPIPPTRPDDGAGQASTS